MKVNRIIEPDAMSSMTAYHTEIGTPEDQAVQARLVSERGFNQEESFYVGRKYPTVVIVGGRFAMRWLTYHEPVAVLPGLSGVIPVNISGPVRSEIQNQGKAGYRKVAMFIKGWVEAKDNVYRHLFVGRKNKIFVSKIPFEEHPWGKHFAKYGELFRNELLGVSCGVRGIKGQEGLSIAMPEKIYSEVADGVWALLTKSQGAELGMYPAVWQNRYVYPFIKGTVVVWHDDSCQPFFNLDTIKLKVKDSKGKLVMEPIPDVITTDKMVHIANSDELYDIRISHQLGYVLKNTIKSKGGAWGDMPGLIANTIVKTVADKTGVEQQEGGYIVHRVSIEELMPDYIRSLISMNLPKEHIATVQQISLLGEAKNDDFKAKVAGKDIVDTVLLAARPIMGKMAMFVCLSAERTGMKPGWYKPENALRGQSAFSDHVGRVPFMAHGGGIQKIKWAGTSPLKNVVMAIVSEDRRDEVSKTIWKQLAAMGADSDGDRIIILSVQGLKMLKSAGLYIEENPEAFKAKNPYPGLNKWTIEQLIEFWITSTPRLGNVGKGDVITRDAIDAYKSGMFDWQTYMKFALHGAGEVQVGVSAPKYFFHNPYFNLAPYTAKELKEAMEADGVGRGRHFHGLLWDEARTKAEGMLADYLNDVPVPVTLAKGKFRKEWVGGFSTFHGEIALFSPELGMDWPTYVRRAFVNQLKVNNIDVTDIKKGLKGKIAEYCQQLIREYIYRYPHRMNIWVWMLDERFTGVEKDRVLSVIGLPVNAE